MASGVFTTTKPKVTEYTDEYKRELIDVAGLKLPEFTDDDLDSVEHPTELDVSIPEKMKKINDFISERFGDILSSDDKDEIIGFVKKTIFDCDDEEEDDDRNIYSDNEKINKILKQEREEFKSFIDILIRELTPDGHSRNFRFHSLRSFQNNDYNVFHLCYDGYYYCYYVCYVGRKSNFYRAYMYKAYIPKPDSILTIENKNNILGYYDIKDEIVDNRE